MADPAVATSTGLAPESPVTRMADSVRLRLTAPMPQDGWRGWAAALAITVFAGVLRFWHLGTPKTLVFDEIFYPTAARDYLRYGVEYNDETKAPDFIAHPPVGKWVIAAGEKIFGYDAFGWRFSVALLGTLSILILARAARRLFRSTLLGCVAALLMSLEGQHFVHSRTGLLDLIVMFFALAAFACLLIDRDAARARLADRLPPAGELDAWGPSLGWRPWRLAAGVLLGLCVGTKWSGLFFIMAFGLMTVLWDLGARRTAGVRRPWFGTLRRDVAPAVVALVVIPLVVYIASWTGWFHSDAAHAYDRNWAASHPSNWPVPAALRSLWHYQTEMYGFNTGLRTPHPYMSNPWSWLVIGRPVSFYYEGPKLGEHGCTVDQCSQAITALGTPAIWWTAVPCIAVLLVLWAGGRDWRAGAILAGFAAGYLPWFNYQARTIFSFYSIAFVPYLILAITLVLGMVLGPVGASARRRSVGAWIVGAYCLIVLANFAWLFPIWTAQVIPYADWHARMWLPSWI